MILRGYTRFGTLPWDYWRVWLAREFGWTLDYIDGLDVHEVFDMISIVKHHDKAEADAQRAASPGRIG